jgi:hypothetical protein
MVLGAMLLSIASFAAPRTGEIPFAIDEEVTLQVPTGAISAGRGEIFVNGNKSKIGATILSGNIIATGSNSAATIDFGQLGRTEIGSNTTIVPHLLSPGMIQLVLDRCGSITESVPAGTTAQVVAVHRPDAQVEVVRGQVKVTYGKLEQKTLSSGQKMSFGKVTEVTASGEAIFKISCGGGTFAAWYLGPLVGVLGFLGGGVPPPLTTISPVP